MGRKGLVGTTLCLVALVLIGAQAVSAHQTTTNKGVTVTLHVTQDDEPVAGQPSQIIVTKVRAGSYRFRWSRCKCYLKASDTQGRVVLNRQVGSRSTRITFPRAGAYEIVFTGRVHRNGRSKRFRTTFAIRAQ